MGLPLGAAHQPAEPPVGVGVVGQQRQLVGGVEGHQRPAGVPRGQQRLPAGVAEDPLDEALAQERVVEPPLLLDRQERQPRREHPGEGPGPVAPGRPAPRPVDPDPLQAAGGRVLLDHEAGEVEGRELPPPGPRPRPSIASVQSVWLRSATRRGRCGPGGAQPARHHQADRLARHRHADLHLRADRHPLHVRAEEVDAEGIALVAAVVADVLAEEAGGDAEARAGGGGGMAPLYARGPGPEPGPGNGEGGPPRGNPPSVSSPAAPGGAGRIRRCSTTGPCGPSRCRRRCPARGR